MYLNSCGIVAVAAKENGQIAVSRRKEKNDERKANIKNYKLFC